MPVNTLNVSLVSLGCPKNLVDAEVMLGHLPADRYQIVVEEDQADIIIVNTCAFINDAKEESVDTILEVAEYKHSGRCRLLIVAGVQHLCQDRRRLFQPLFLLCDSASAR